MTVKRPVFMFLDDDRFKSGSGFVLDGARHPRYYYPLIGAEEILKIMDQCDIVENTTVEGAIAYIEENGCPDFISFDNDLQRELEGYDLAKWITEKDMDQPGFIPKNFKFFVHSQNTVAKEKIYNYLNQYLEQRIFPDEKEVVKKNTFRMR